MATILIVDDRPTNRQFLLTLLGYTEHRLLEAADGAQALERVRSERPDLVITDILMPTMDGYEFTQRLRADPELAATKVIFYTATYSVKDAEALALSCGVQTVLPKPSEPQEILAAISRTLGLGEPDADVPIAVSRATEVRELRKIGDKLAEHLEDFARVKQMIESITQRGEHLASEREHLKELSQRFSDNFASLQRTGMRLAALEELSVRLMAERKPERLIDTFLGAATRIMGSAYAAIGMLDEREQEIAVLLTRGFDAEVIRPCALDRTRIPGMLLGERQLLRKHEARGGVKGLPSGHPMVRSILGTPVATKDKVYGWLYFAEKLGGDEFNSEDEQLASTMAAQLGVLHENAAQYHAIQHHAARLQIEVGERRKAEEQVRALNEGLEKRVAERTAELQSANRELESFSYSVSHDLRAPLRAINGYTGMLVRDHGPKLPPEARKLCTQVQENTARMCALIDDLLEFSRLGRKALIVQRLNLAHLARECLKELAQEQEGRKVEVTIGDLLPCSGDLILLKQVLLNLLSNALKFTRKRDVARIEVGAEVRNGEYLCYVRDNGAGFDMRYADKLFEVFQRLHPQSEFAGTGVGLAIVRRAIEKHGGKVWAESASDQGATFYFSLPTGNGVQGG